MESEYNALSQSMSELIGIIEVLKTIQTFVISRKTQTPKYCTHYKDYFISDIPSSKVYKDK